MTIPWGARTWLASGAFLLLCLISPQLRAQGQILYAATDLVDTTPGSDLWQYDYTLSGITFQANEGFSVFFDSAVYRNLQSFPPAVSADWNVLSVQPDVLLSAPGFYDALAVHNLPSPSSGHRITFVWMGQGMPGTQPFTVYNTDFSTRSFGQTMPVPEPRTVWLIAAGLPLFLGWQRVVHRKKQRNNSHGHPAI